MDMSGIRERMEELGIDLATLTRRYCEIRQAKGESSATPVNRRNMISKAISDDGNPKLETFLDILEALDGEILIKWRTVRVEKFGETAATESIKRDSVA
ncbi:MAG: hypothetical protein NVS2B14_08910 [Chamaesiphon sp.]